MLWLTPSMNMKEVGSFTVAIIIGLERQLNFDVSQNSFHGPSITSLQCRFDATVAIRTPNPV